MITDFFLGFLTTTLTTVFGWLPAPSPPSFLTSLNSAAATVTGYGADLSAWFPFGMTGGVIGFVLAGWGIGVSIKLIRIALSFLTAGGGSAA